MKLLSSSYEKRRTDQLNTPLTGRGDVAQALRGAGDPLMRVQEGLCHVACPKGSVGGELCKRKGKSQTR